MWRKWCTGVKTFKVVYYKHVVTINHTRCDTVCLETLPNIGNIRILEINIGIFENLISIHLHVKDLICWVLLEKKGHIQEWKEIKFYNSLMNIQDKRCKDSGKYIAEI